MEESRNAPYFNEEDRISRLPDALIHHILSFIDTKYAVQASVLSKRYMGIWKSLPFLRFSRKSFSRGKEHDQKFICFVDMVFILRDDSDIQKLVLLLYKIDKLREMTQNVNRWIVHAVRRNVQGMTIQIDKLHSPAYEISPQLLNCKSLMELVMHMSGGEYVDLILPKSMGLPRLKSLYLGGLTISNVELSKRLISSCPALESLHIADCDVRTLTVESLSLKRFIYVRKHLRSQTHTMTDINLSAPNLKEFLCSSSAESDKDENAETFSKLPSEEKEVYAKRVMKFLEGVCKVQQMRLSPGFLEVLSQAADLLDCQPTRLCNLWHLVLNMWSVRGCLRAIAYLCKISPNITLIQLVLESKESNLADVGDDWEAGLSSPEMLSRLKFVQIEKAEGCDAELKLLSFLLKNAKVLEKVAIYFRSSVGSPDRVKQVRQFGDKLSALPTASSKIKIMLL